ncbi:MAG: CHAP domain-containing protein [Prevotella sp.]|nr:CHAP domain-containing protein [Prevotella sp.]
MKKIVVLLIIALGFVFPYKYNSDRVVNFAERHANEKSRCMCAWYTMRALHHGGCYPCGIYPAYAYEKVLPRLGFVEVSHPKKGDISVLSSNSRHPYGHIAVYDGKRWISDYKQRRVYPNTVYEKESTVKYYRQTDGWHTANIWVSPIDLWEYIQVLCNNYRKIKLL